MSETDQKPRGKASVQVNGTAPAQSRGAVSAEAFDVKPAPPTASVSNLLAGVSVEEAPPEEAVKRYAAILKSRNDDGSEIPITRYVTAVTVAGVSFAKTSKVHTGRGPDELAVSKGQYALLSDAQLERLKKDLGTRGLRPSYDEKGRIQGCEHVDWGTPPPGRIRTQRQRSDVPLAHLVELYALGEKQRLDAADFVEAAPEPVEREDPEGVSMLNGSVRQWSPKAHNQGSSTVELVTSTQGSNVFPSR